MFVPALVASDLDGTLLRSDHSVSERTLRTLGRLRERGIPFVAITGRPRRWLQPVIDQTGPIGPIVCGNGAVVMDERNEHVLAEFLIPPDVLDQVTKSLRTAIPELVFAAERGDRMLYEPGYPLRGDLALAGEAQQPIERIVAEGASKLLVRVRGSDGGDPEALYGEIGRLAGESCTVTHSGFAGLVEITALGVDKSTGLAWIADHYGVDPQRIVAFGDMPNDAAMLRWAGRGVVVASAHPEAVAAADAVTMGNDADGVAIYLDELLDNL
ncbi:MAG: cof-like hydrolase [Actinomycetia bacterium]|jgi:Cof subfamily protein (haloacid dehalogenase superfamily)|nr:cof-like hydrolase [Actinomycetes bacterium]